MAYINKNTINAEDQKSLTFVESQAAYIEPRVRKEQMAKVMYPELVQIDTSMDVADDTIVTYLSRPGTGRMMPLANGVHDLPRVQIEYDRMTREAYASGIAYGWDDMEIEKARRLNRPLSRDKVATAFETAEREKEKTVLHGNAAYNWPGLITNRQNGTLDIKAPNKWSAASTSQIFRDIRMAFTKIRSETNKIINPDTLLLPVDAEGYLFEPMADGKGGMLGISVYEYLRKHNPFTARSGVPLTIKIINELDSAGPDSNKKLTNGDPDPAAPTYNTERTGAPMAVLYDSDDEMMRFLMPQDLTFIGPQRIGFTQTWYGRMKLGGVQIFHPASVCYIHGI